MDKVESIIKAFLYNDPSNKKARSRVALLEFTLLMLGYEKIADFGISGEVLYLHPNRKKVIRLRRW